MKGYGHYSEAKQIALEGLEDSKKHTEIVAANIAPLPSASSQAALSSLRGCMTADLMVMHNALQSSTQTASIALTNNATSASPASATVVVPASVATAIEAKSDAKVVKTL